MSFVNKNKTDYLWRKSILLFVARNGRCNYVISYSNVICKGRTRLYLFIMSNICLKWIFTLQLSERQGTPYLKQLWHLQLKWLPTSFFFISFIQSICLYWSGFHSLTFPKIIINITYFFATTLLNRSYHIRALVILGVPLVKYLRPS